MNRESEWDTARLIAADKQHVWHPFTAMADWCAPAHKPLVLVEGRGALLWDSEGREYIDGNSSIWTNIHGHNHPRINAAIRRQLDRVAHTSFLGFTNPAAVELASSITQLLRNQQLTRVFYSDDGSTAIEAALRITRQYWRLSGSDKSDLVAFRGGYHGDTAGAASLGAGQMFDAANPGWHFPAQQVSSVDALEQLSPAAAAKIAAVVIEPLVQGAAGIRLWPGGTLTALRKWCDRAGALLIVDEVLTGFGRTGRMFACEHEDVKPDLLVLGKGVTAGYLPLAMTVVTEKVFEPFGHANDPAHTLFYGHSYTGNALGCAAAIASLEVFRSEAVLDGLQGKIELLRAELAALDSSGAVSEIRQCGFIAGIEINPAAASGYSPGYVGAAICEVARRHGLLTRPIRDVIVLMPPFCITADQLRHAVDAIRLAIAEVCTVRRPTAFSI